ncbi:Bax inhibitor-1/YccA family protein [bacterium]|nr:Bax inhibitor-1/YccA family protein [bacterium]
MSSPVLNEETFNRFEFITDETIPDHARHMTLSGTINKAAFLLAIVIAASLISYNITMPIGLTLALIPITLILAIMIYFKPQHAPWLSSLYCGAEGLILGEISSYASETYDGVVGEAIFCTMAVVFAMLAAYRFGIIKVNNTFRSVIYGATMGIALYYLFMLITRLFGLYITALHVGPIAIITNIVICGIAAFNLAIDFDNIKIGVDSNAPKLMEWYCAYSLMVTIIWVYIEILRLLGRRRN